MTARILHSPDDVGALATMLRRYSDWPIRVQVTKAAEARTKAQNRTIHRWFREIAHHMGDRSWADVKVDCNLEYGRPILDRDNEEWSSTFGYIFDALNLPSKKKAIRVLDIPFTRSMTVPQLTEYMSQMLHDYREMGIYLTDPELRKYEELK